MVHQGQCVGGGMCWFGLAAVERMLVGGSLSLTLGIGAGMLRVVRVGGAQAVVVLSLVGMVSERAAPALRRR